MSELSAWRVLSQHHLVEDAWISLRADRCVTAEGVEVAPYYVLEYPDWVHVVAFNETDDVLLVEQYRHAAAQITLELPAGRMDPGDASPETTARRELLEETGCRAEGIRLVNSASPNPASHDNRVHTVVATGVSFAQAPQDDPRERLQSHWVTVDQAVELAAMGALPAMQAASLFSALWALGRLRLTPRTVA